MAEFRKIWICACLSLCCCVNVTVSEEDASANADNSSRSPCRSSCGGVEVKYPLAIDDGCGAPQFRNMLSCDQGQDLSQDLEFHTISGTYKVQDIDYRQQKLTVFDPNMSTCNTLQPSPSKEFRMEKVQSLVIPPSPDTLFILLNCSVDSPLLHRYSSLCTNFSGKSCDLVYSCPALKSLIAPVGPNATENTTAAPPPPCCATDYNTLNFLSLEVLDCSHFTAIYNAESLNGMNPLDWPYGIHLSYSIPDTVCPQCQHTGGTCGFDTETERSLCLCNGGMNSTMDCGTGSRSAAHSLNTANVQLLPVLFSIIAIWLIQHKEQAFMQFLHALIC